MSIAGGYHKAVELARTAGCDCVQVFTKNNNQWRAKTITEVEACQFRTCIEEFEVCSPLSHSSYLLNLASPDQALWQKSVESLVVELQRAAQLGIPYVVIHPGAHMGAGEEAGIQLIIEALDQVLDETADVPCGVLLETTAGQGSCIGHRFENLADIRAGLKNPERVAVCFDTCHVFVAGYPIQSRRDYLATLREFDRVLGLDLIKAFHLNDSKKPLGSRVDRHDHIGRGYIGPEAFQHLLNDRRFRDIPMYLETPKGKEGDQDLDVINLQTLRGLVARRPLRA